MRRARWERQQADAHYALGELGEVLLHGSRALRWLGYPAPESNGGWTLDLTKNLPLQLLHRLRPGRFVAKTDERREIVREAAIATQRLAVRFYYNFDALPLIASSLRAVNLAEHAGGKVSVATTYGVLAMSIGISKLHGLGHLYAQLARNAAQASGDRVGLVFALYAKAAWRIGDGAWDEVRALCNEALAIGEAGGAPDPQDVAIAKTLLAHVEFYVGNFEASRRIFGEIEAAARVRDNDQHIAWGLYAAARALIPLGRIDEARAMLEDAQVRLEAQIDVPSRIICPGLLARVYMTQGERDKAITLADLTAARIRTNLPTVFATVAGYVGVAEVYLAEWERAKRDGVGAREARSTVRGSMMALWTLALSIPLGRPYYHRVRGCELRIDGSLRAAKRSFARALDWATRLAMPYEQALALVELTGLAPRGSREREGYARRAEALLTHLQCPDDLARLRRLAL